MPFTRDHLLLRFGGPAAQGQETWSCGVRLAPNAELTGAELLDLANASLESISESVEGYFISPESDFNGLCELEYVKLNPISAATEKYLFPDSPVEFLYEGTLPTGLGGNGPLQLAYCVTLRGTYRRGSAALGRYYVPVGGAQVTSTGVMTQQDALTKADRAGTFLEQIQVVGADPADVLRLRLFGDGLAGPRESRVRLVEVGNVFDTQRRRRNQVDETYYAAATWVEPTD